MNIGAIGWWNYDNQGDLAMLSSLRQALVPHRLLPIDTGFPVHGDRIYRLNRLDFLILGGGTLISGKPTMPFDVFDRWAPRLECPLGVVGLGIDPFSEQYWPATEALLNRAEFFYVRDGASQDLLRNHPRVQLMPDLTFAYPLPVCEKSPANTAAVPVCGVNLRRSTSFDPMPWLQTFARLPVQIKGVPLSSFNVFDESALLRRLDPESPKRFDAALYGQLDFMIGTAFHAILFAVQSAVPVIAIDYAPKVRHFMKDNGLAHYVLGPDEHHKLPELVDELLMDRAAIVANLYSIRARLHQEAQRNMHSIREQIERHSPRCRRSGPKVTIVIMGSGKAEADHRTLAACTSQTYENVEVLLSTHENKYPMPSPASTSEVKTIPTDPQASYGISLRKALASANGEYLTWIDGGDWFTGDALLCLVDLLEKNLQWDMVYTDYYMIDDENLSVGYHFVPAPDKLFRRDVVGPCFLMRRSLLSDTEPLATHTRLVGYDLWLRASAHSTFVPFHAPVFYSRRPIYSRALVEQERKVRRHWRKSRPAWFRAFWRAADTSLVEQVVVQPIGRIRHLFRRRSHAKWY